MNNLILTKELELTIYFEYIKNKYYKPNPTKFYLVLLFIIFYLSIPGYHIPSLEFTRTRVSAIMEQRALENFLIFYPSQEWLRYSDFPMAVKQAVIVLEDDGFTSHKGIDWRSIRSAMMANKRKGKVVKGGSTITMQTAKNIYFSTRRHYFRKAKEILTAMRMEKELPKEVILEHYLNIVELGKGIFGFEAASEKFFGKSAKELSKVQVARLVAVFPSPLKHKPTDNSKLVSLRKNIALQRMSSALLPE